AHTAAEPAWSRADPWSSTLTTGFRLNGDGAAGVSRTVRLVDGEKPVTITVTHRAEQSSLATSADVGALAHGVVDVVVKDAAGVETAFRDVRILEVEADGNVTADVGDRRVKGRCVRDGEELVVFFEGGKTTLTIPADPGAATTAGAAHGAGSVKTPMPCKISAVNVSAGQKVVKGQALIILEAMKMEHVIKSPTDGVVKKVHYKVGELVGEGKNLVTFEEEAIKQ
ncbi:hypothetical protein HK101_005183, partial [Irineochytrium annulatum]